MLLKLPIALAQVKAGHTSQKLRNEICESIYSLHLLKRITKKGNQNFKNG